MDADYLRRTVGSYLAEGLAEVACVRPSDPIQYLAQWLLKHDTNLKERKLGSLQPPRVSITVTDTIPPTTPPQLDPGTHAITSEVESSAEHLAEPEAKSEVLAASPLDLVLKEREGGGEGQEDIIESRIKEKIEEEEMVAEELVEKVVMEAVVEAEVVEDNVNEDVTVESPVKQEPN